MSAHISVPEDTYIDKTQQDERRFIRMGWLVVGAGLFGFFVWAGFAPLDKGVVSPGTVTISGNRKTIQAATSGIIRNIAVRDGDKIKAGDLLVQLNQVQAQALVDSLRDKYYTMLATEGRLLAERDGVSKVTYSPAFDMVKDKPRVAEIMALQTQLFNARRLSLKSETDGYKQAMDGVRFQLEGLQESRVNKEIQLTSLREQMSGIKQLTIDGYLPRNRYLELLRQFSEVNSSISEMTGRIGQLQKQLQEFRQRIDQRFADYRREVRTQLSQTQMDTNELYNKLEMASFDLSNTVITSPVDGTVVGLNIFTQGGTVEMGEHLMDIVPSEATLIVDSRLKVELIDKVHNGLPVDLMFTAFNQNRTPKIPGTVTLVSADRLVDKTNGEPYYQMQVTVTPEGMKMINSDNIRPGMPVDVFVKTGARSLLSYLFKPVLDRTHTSLTEE